MYLRPGIPGKKEHVRGRAQMIEWQHLDADRMYAERRKLVLGVGAVEFSGDESIASACEAVFSCPRLFGPRACDLRSSQRRGAER